MSDNRTHAGGGKELPAGTRIEEFVIERVLGSGGFGITYLARDTSLNRQVVIKENLPSQFAHRDTTSLTVRPGPGREDQDNFRWSLENFSREAETLASLRHPGIVPVLRRFEAFGTAYFVMPFVEGITLEELTKERRDERRAFTEDELHGLLERILDALAHLHDRGIYHRDIKPGNILITHEGVPVLIDFGSARQRLSERSMTVVESAGYTPFEQLQTRGRIGPWSDLYALGSTLAKVITGEAPPKATDRAFDDPWTALAQRPQWTARYSAAFLESIDHAMAVRIEERFQDAGEWLAALEKQTTPANQLPPTRELFQENLPHKQKPIPEQDGHEQTRQSNRKPQRHLLVAMLALLAFGAVCGVALIGRDRGSRGADETKTGAESRVVTKTEAEMPPEKIPEQVEKRPPAVATSAGIPMGVPLTTELPPELIEGTPKPMNVPNLRPAPTRPPEFLVPEGTVLLSRGKPVTSSDDAPIIGSIYLITDGHKDAGEGYFVELLDGLQWVQIDLEQSSLISAVWLWHFHSQKRAYNDVIIQVSEDPEFKKGVTTIFNNDYDDSAKMGRGSNQPYVETRFGMLAVGKGAQGRYVRLYSNGNTSNEMNHYIEVEVFGQLPDATNVPVWVPMPINPELPIDKRHEIIAKLKTELGQPERLAKVSKDVGLVVKWGLLSDEACAAELGKRLFVRAGDMDTPEGKVPAIHVGLTGKRKERDVSGVIAMRLMDDVWKILGIEPPPSDAAKIRGDANAKVEDLTPALEGFALIPAGSFSMGDALGDGKADELPVHEVYVSAFFMARHEVTRALWDKIRTWGIEHGYNDLPEGKGKADNHPVYLINWDDIVKWCNARSEMDGLVPCYTVGGKVYKSGTGRPACDRSANGYRLPTEAEWEKAARGGISGMRFPWGNEISHTQANFNNQGKESYQAGSTGNHPTYIEGTSPVGVFKANSYGLYDMAGNVWEMCSDWYSIKYYASSAAKDPQGPDTGSKRVLRGGSWFNTGEKCRIAERGLNANPFERFLTYGFRLARSVSPETTSWKTTSKDGGRNETIIDVSINCSPKNPTGNIFAAADRISMHPDYTGGGQVGTSWTLLANKKIITSSGTFLSGDLISPRGRKMANGPYYVLESEWEE
jgi:formylglycine-generating enzyme required for sulfatase activity/serine/threonine protein kinase